MKIGNLNLEKEVMLIAEIGNNHEGDVRLAKKMIKEAAASGAHAVKFQTIEPEQLVARSDESRFKQLSKFSLKRKDYEMLAKVADDERIIFLSTPFSIHAVDWLEPLVPAYKIASGDNNFDPLLEYIASKRKPIILSTGMSEIKDIEHACEVINLSWQKLSRKPLLALLHCVSAYPANPLEINLATIKFLQKYCDVVGYSDHVMGIDVAIMSVIAGARIIEKHFTLDKNYSDFRDHQLSANPSELKALAEKISETSKILGPNIKKITESEKEVAAVARRSIVASRKMKAGEKISLNELKWLRPANGTSPVDSKKFLGQTLKVDVNEGQLLNLSMFE